MLAKVIASRASRTISINPFGRRIRYVCRKAVRTALANLAGTLRDAELQMQATLGLNRRLRRPAYHLVLSWSEVEHPTDDEMMSAARRALEHLGASENQSVIAIHRDRTNAHVHLVVNRIHPVTGHSLDVSHDYARLEHACRCIEHEMGWPQDRGRFDTTITSGHVTLIPKPLDHWHRRMARRAAGLRPDGATTRAHERRTGLPSLRDLISDKVLRRLRQVLSGAADWPQVHAACTAEGLSYIRHRSGARLVRRVDGAWMPAGHLGCDCSPQNLAAKLGSALMPDAGIATGSTEGNISVAYPTGLVNLLASKERERALQRTLQKTRSALRGRLDRQRIQIASAIGRSRTPSERALQDQERRMRNSLSEARAAAIAALPQQVPDGGWTLSRRYRHVLRGTHGAEGMTGQEREMDHTLARQAWILGSAEDQADMPMPLCNILKKNPKSLRRAGDHGIIAAHRNEQGSIVGFEHMSLHDDVRGPHVLEGGHRAVCGLGPADAERIYITPDLAGAIAMSMIAGPAGRIHIGGSGMAEGEIEALRNSIDDSHITIAAMPFHTEEDLAWLSHAFPGAAVIRVNALPSNGENSNTTEAALSSPSTPERR